MRRKLKALSSYILSQYLKVTNTSFTPIAQQINSIKSIGGKSIYQQFENNLYTLIEREGIIPYHQQNSLFGTYNSQTNNFTLSNAFINNPQITLSNVQIQNNVSQNYDYGISANASANIINNLYVSGSNYSSFYQSALWANFVDTNIGNNLSIGQELYNNGTWDNTSQIDLLYTMPDSTNPIFTKYPLAKTAYDNLMNTLGLSNNLTGAQFNQQILTLFPNYYDLQTNDLNNDNYAATLNKKTLFTIFSYQNGEIVNQYALYTNNSTNGVLGLNLEYKNTLQNLINTGNYEFGVNIYGNSYFTQTNSTFNSANNILLSELDAVQMSNQTPYSWSDLANNETMNLIPYDVYNNINVISSIPNAKSSDWLPETNYQQQLNEEAKDRNIVISIATIATIVVLVILGTLIYLVEKRRRKNNKQYKQAKKFQSFKQQHAAEGGVEKVDDDLTDIFGDKI